MRRVTAPLFPDHLRNRSIENRSNDNRFRINWSHSVKLTGYVFLRSPPRLTHSRLPLLQFLHFYVGPPAVRVPSSSTPLRPNHETKPSSTLLILFLHPALLCRSSYSLSADLLAWLSVPLYLSFHAASRSGTAVGASLFFIKRTQFWVTVHSILFYLISIRDPTRIGHLPVFLVDAPVLKFHLRRPYTKSLLPLTRCFRSTRCPPRLTKRFRYYCVCVRSL